MNSETYCGSIQAGLAQLVAEVRIGNASNLTDINLHAENFFRDFLNLLFGWKLENANAADQNAKGIDLLYPGGNVVAQVSSTTTREKVQKSLEKSAGYAGAQFYFIAIDDRCPKYKKAFDNHGLIFDPKTDVLDAEKLHKLALHCKDRDGKKAIDIQRELAELVEKHFSRMMRRAELGLRPLGSGKLRSRFEYNANVVKLVGREKEMDELRRFVTEKPELPFRWWAVTGPGAAGKTRLAYELQARLLAEGEWDVRVVSPALLEHYETDRPDLSEACPWKTLLIVDYVQKYTGALAKLIRRLSDPALERPPLRLLLLERDIRDEDGNIAWLAQIWGTDHRVHDACFRRAPMELKAMEAENGADPLAALIRDFADRQYAHPEEDCENPHPLPAGKEKALRDRLAEIDPGLLRPLFAMLLADAWVRDPKTERWSREELLGHIVDREWDLTAGRLKDFHRRLLPSACRILWMSATAIGAGDAPLPCGELEALLPRQWQVLSEAAQAHASELESWTLTPPEALLNRAGLLTDGRIEPMRPDLLGEYFVLDGLEHAGPAERSAFYSAVLREFDAALIFFGRMLNDYETLLRTPARQKALFPDAPGLDPESTALYARLLRRLFEDSRSSGTRAWLAARLEALAARQTEEREETARICNDAASVLEGQGDYPKALEYYEKARKIREAVLGPEHPDTAQTYNNLAGVYYAMGDYLKALEYYEKTQKINEAVNGPEHPSTATTYNNLAEVYRAMGDYPKALEYHEKAREIREAVLGPEHPSTAATYNNLAGVYYAMGDYPKALEYYDKALVIVKAVLGEQHPYVASTYHNLAHVYLELRDLDSAIRCSDQALAVFRRVLGPEHPNTLIVKRFNDFLHMLSALREAVGDNLWDLLEQMKSNGQEPPDE